MYVPSNSPKYVCYRCRNKIGVENLEVFFQEQLKGFLVSPEDIARHVGQADEEIKAKEEMLRSLEAEQAKVRQEMDKVYRLYTADQISPEGFGRQYGPLEERSKAIEEELPRLQGEVDFLKIQLLSKDEILAEARDLYGRWPSLSQENRRQIIEAVLQSITVGKEEIEIDLAYFPSPAEIVVPVSVIPSAEEPTVRQRINGAALPFSHVTMRGPRIPDFPISYPARPKSVGDHIRKRRLDLGLKQQDLSRVLRVSAATLANWERGRVIPTTRHFPAIIEFLGYDPNPPGATFAGRLHTVRRRLGLSQRALAVRLGIDPSTVAEWE